MNHTTWTPALESRLRELFPAHCAADIAAQLGIGLSSVYYKAGRLGLRKSKAWIAERASEYNARPDHGGRQHRFKPGHATWNKGTSFTAGGRSAETRFKPGHRGGKALALWHPVGALRINADGYMQRKINDDLPMHKRWRAEHLLVWESANGPLPDGHIIVFKDGNRMNFAMDNLECITRRENMLRNTAHRHGKELFALSQLRGALTRQINRRQRGNTHQGETP